ncbi:hypothetical protein [Nannocystis bainbridge]|uniref:Uncharacterized protein n=1 Tax=Nannocystis bainbridge TaxID=2995303 RepID=A0ABT5DSA2_9BACT|nr:hypothetical protein [Nannocystis bainbridge]MDC0716498.1 hypothetical protein [Nannocystis bainbridge]
MTFIVVSFRCGTAPVPVGCSYTRRTASRQIDTASTNFFVGPRGGRNSVS